MTTLAVSSSGAMGVVPNASMGAARAVLEPATLRQVADAADVARFMSYVDKLPNGCWFWTGAMSRGKGDRKWYGSFWVKGRTVRAHRFAAEVVGRSPPVKPGEERDHKCVFSLCVYPDHIENVPAVVNQERKTQRRTLTRGSRATSFDAMFDAGA